jgi:hypothetical protein
MNTVSMATTVNLPFDEGSVGQEPAAPGPSKFRFFFV